MHEWSAKQRNERTYDWTDEGTNKRMNEQKTERMDTRNERTSME